MSYKFRLMQINKILTTILWIVAFIMLFSISSFAQISHKIWDDLLKKHVDDNGWVNYKEFKKDTIRLHEYLELLKNNPPNEKKWSKEEQMAFWINAYNAFTVKLILDNYPLTSIKDIKKGIPFVNTVWDIKFIKIGKNTYDLNNIEHSKLRKKFKDPRIHFAINCASISCPNLNNNAFISDILDQQLNSVAQKFINDKSKNIIKSNKLELSKIFSWYQNDFTTNSPLIDYLNRYSAIKINANANIDYMDYNWKLNGM